MKLWKTKYEVRYGRYDPNPEIGEEYFYLENEDDPKEYIDNFYEKETARKGFSIKRVGELTLILIRTRLDDEFAETLSKDGEVIEEKVVVI